MDLSENPARRRGRNLRWHNGEMCKMAQPDEQSAVGDRPTVEDSETNPAVTPSGKIICPGCGDTYQSIAHHLALSSVCSYPALTPRQQEVLTGILLSRGGVQNPPESNGSLRVTDQNREVLTWIRDQLGWIGGSVSEKALDELPESDGNSETADTTYILRTGTHPQFSVWRQRWHADNGDRTIPPQIHRTRRMLRTTYALVGNYTAPNEDRRASVMMPFSRTKPSSEALRRLCTGFGPTITREEDHKPTPNMCVFV